MTVLLEENAAGECSGAPPRKKLCLSLSTRNKLGSLPASKATHVNTNKSSDRSTGKIIGYQNLCVPEANPITSANEERLEPPASAFKESSQGVAMLNGYLPGDGHNKSSTDESPGSDTGVGCSPIATLCNLGNTCFLNSVLYTLRFAPAFLHNLHHLVVDLSDLNSKQHQVKIKSSSLGRNVSSSSTGKSWSSKDLLSLGGSSLSDGKSKIQVVTERLHELYESLHAAEIKENSDPFQPDIFLHALREVNQIFEGNQQHDAHELLVCLLDNIRETCRLLADQHKLAAEQSLAAELEATPVFTQHQQPQPPAPSGGSTKWGVRKSWKRKKVASCSSKAPASNGLLNGLAPEHCHLLNGAAGPHQPVAGFVEHGQLPATSTATSTVADSAPKSEAAAAPGKKGAGHNFVAEDFEGVTVLRTTCLECEHTTERKETFCDICVPIVTADQENEDGEIPQRVSEVYQAAIVTNEYLRDLNKYWCEQCLRYNEARRSVRYERLPKILVLQLKRFSSTFGSMVCMSKVNDYMPTPLTLACFCEQCSSHPEEQRPHHYKLFAVIMHLGATIASGHYVSYVKASENSCDYYHCDRDKRKSSSLSSASSSSSKAGSSSSSSGDKVGGLLKFFRHKSSSNSNLDTSSVGAAAAKLSGSSNSMYYRHTCRSMDCCGVRLNRSIMNGGDMKCQMNGLDPATTCVDTSVPEPVWLECDDDTVRILTRKEFEDILAPKPSKNSALTPYLLFYSKCP